MKTRVVLTLLCVALALPARADQASAHHDMVMSHGAQVMPFDQKVGMHMFTSTQNGGELEIMVHNGDTKQIALVRAHLRSVSAKFAVGDYSDPQYIHGKNMPGLAAMKTEMIGVRYADTDKGALIVFYGVTPKAIAGIHQWIAAQTADHGSHSDMKM